MITKEIDISRLLLSTCESINEKNSVTIKAVIDMLSIDIDLTKSVNRVNDIRTSNNTGAFTPLLYFFFLAISANSVVMNRYIGKNGIKDGTCLFAEIITNIERMLGNNLLLLNITGATTSTKNPIRSIIGGNSGEFHVESTPRSRI
jgi:hypothetical protein